MGNQPLTIGLKIDDPSVSNPFQDATTKSGGRSSSNRSQLSFYKAGTTVTGRVYLSVTKNNLTARSIRLKLIGKENLVLHHTSEVEERDRHGRRTGTSQQDHYEHSSHDVVSLDYPLHIFDGGTLVRGQFEFPFALDLPPTLPSSLHKLSKGQSNCEVVYELVAEVDQSQLSSNPVSNLFSKNPSASQKLEVAAITSTTRHHDTSLHIPPEDFAIQACCCCRYMGYITMECQVDATTIRPGASCTNSGADSGLGLRWRAQNRSTATVNQIKAQLVQKIEWSSHGHRECLSSVLAQTTFDARGFPELDKLKRRQVQRFRRTGRIGPRNTDGVYQAAPSSDGSYETSIYGVGNEVWHNMNLPPIPSHHTTADSYQGHAIQIRHVLLVTLETKGCCTTNPEASTLMLVYKSMDDGIGPNDSYQPYGSSLDECPPTAPSQESYSYTDSVQSGGIGGGSGGFSSVTYSDSSRPSAPSDAYDDNNGVTAVAEAHAVRLPDDWNAETLPVQHIPMAEAVVLTNTNTAASAATATASASATSTMEGGPLSTSSSDNVIPAQAVAVTATITSSSDGDGGQQQQQYYYNQVEHDRK